MTNNVIVKNAAPTRRFLCTPVFSRLWPLPLSPLHICLWAACALLSACVSEPGPLSADICELALPAIGQVQGKSEISPLLDQEATVRGIVTMVEPGSGFFIHDDAGDGDPATSEGLWIADPTEDELPFPGDRWALRGTVAEQANKDGSVTALTAINGRQRCARHQPLPAVNMALPLSRREALESMRVRLPARLTVAQPPNPYQRDRVLVAAERLFAPTEMVRPGAAANTLAQRFAAASLMLVLPPASRLQYRAGDELEAFTGVLDMRQNTQLLGAAAPAVAKPNPIPQPPSRRGDLRIVSINLYNYFNGDGQGGGFPAPRGAQSAEQFAQQRSATLAAITALDADILALQELENDGFGPHSAIADLLAGLNAKTADQPWALIQPDMEHIGADQISVGLIYRKNIVQPLDEALLFMEPPFDNLSRPVLAQRFQMAIGYRRLLVASVHLKSKGSCPDSGEESNQNDGQGCWNPTRVTSARLLSEWLKEQAGGDGILALGDFNSYRMEDPIRVMTRAGLVELVGRHSIPPFYSYIYRGGRGTLDYAFASPDLTLWSVAASHWHVNADETAPPPADGALWRRFSDHDPVIVDLASVRQDAAQATAAGKNSANTDSN